jgi:uncharacterized protein (DUF1697 family)
MPRYAAFLRGVSPMNAKMPELKQAFEAAGFREVRTVLSSGNVVFDARRASETTLERAAEAAMSKRLGQAFLTIVRPVEALRDILASDPYEEFEVSPAAKRIVSFLRLPPSGPLELPMGQDHARLLTIIGREVYSAYLPTPKGPVFMALIERAFGKEVTTRTWDTVTKVARA